VARERQQRRARYKHNIRPESDADSASLQTPADLRDDYSKNERMNDDGAEGGRRADEQRTQH
jgi:hypothetical protein